MRYGVSWVVPPGSFEYDGPWWMNGKTGEGRSVVYAAVVAATPEAAKKVISDAHGIDSGMSIEWGTIYEEADDWSPFCERFPRASWMKWPYPEEQIQQQRTEGVSMFKTGDTVRLKSEEFDMTVESVHPGGGTAGAVVKCVWLNKNYDLQTEVFYSDMLEETAVP